MLLIGISGTALEPQEQRWLSHPAVSGVILFARNFRSRPQVTALIARIRDAASQPLLVTVDQEGGPVQRFRDGFTRLPELAPFGQMYAHDPDAALDQARLHGWLMAGEMRAIGVDLSFAPVVDLARGNRAIGVRAFAAEPEVVGRLARAYIAGMHTAGMAATLKHFPGHGSVAEDTHVDVAQDPRTMETLQLEDLVPFAAGIDAGAEAVMMAHVRYLAVDEHPAGYSTRWIGGILRGAMGFTGVVISDDIGMAAAHSAGGVGARVRAHLDAGCDLVLACAPELVPDALAALENRAREQAVLQRLAGRPAPDWEALAADPRWQQARARLGGPQATRG
ncbi:MAG TPA: beta-N-acetylhexosaminidase [Xanthomonadaceae bacterium]|nr:beta-N-acetylhexosaminidase [Xanthomonadaceae bacterium]